MLLNKLRPEIQAAFSHLLLRTLCILIVEYDCARLVQQSSGAPAVVGNYILAALFGSALILSLINRKAGLILGMSAGIINVAAKILIFITGHEHFPYYPVVWVMQSVMVAYFCFRAYKSENVKIK
jgi:hypothetical protein